MKKYISIILAIAMMACMFTMLSGCGGAKESEGLEFTSNGDGTCMLAGIGSCEDEEIVVPKKSPDGDTVTSIGDKAFERSKIRSIVMADTITEVGIEAFSSSHRLESVDFSNSLKKIGSKAFWGCDTITEIKLPDSLEEFGKTEFASGESEYYSGVFSGCEKLEKINIPKNLKVIYPDTFSGTALEEVKVDADYKYGRVNLSFNNDDKEPIYYYEPAFYLQDPKLDDKDIIELTDTLKSILYAEVFGNKNVKINGKAITLPEPQCTAGFYGLADSQDAFNITEDHKIEIMRYNTKYGKYEIHKMYSDDSDEIYSFEFNDKSQAYEYVDSYGSTVKFVVYDNFFFTINHGRYALNEKCKD